MTIAVECGIIKTNKQIDKGDKQMNANRPNRIKKVFSKKKAIELMDNGFKLITTEPNLSKPDFDVYIFEASEELNRILYGQKSI